MEAGSPAKAPVPPYADALDSLSPRSRGSDSWHDPLAQPSAAPKLRLMCSYGGHIVPRPHDKALCYLGGETRIIAVDRHSSLADLQARLSRFLLAGRSFTLKYQLPSEDLDSLISVSSDEDLENMLEEYDRSSSVSVSSRSSRLRLFLFSSIPQPPPPSAASVSSKSDTWFVDALNAAGPLEHSSADYAVSSIDYLLGLDGGAGVDVGHMPGKLGRHCVQDVQSMPDSPMLETASSFGSASSAPSLASLPPIRVQPEEERAADPKGAIDGTGLQERLAQMNVSGQQPKPSPLPGLDGFKEHLNHFPPPPSVQISTDSASIVSEDTLFPTPSEYLKPSSSIYSTDEKSHRGIMWTTPPHLSQQHQLRQKQHVQDNSTPTDVPTSAYGISRSAYSEEPPSLASDTSQQEAPMSNPSYQLPVRAEHGYSLHQPPLQSQIQQQQSGIPHVSAHHHATGAVLQIPPYYNQILIHPRPPQATTHAYPPQVPLYFLPVHHGSAVNPPFQPKLEDTTALLTPLPSINKQTIPLPSSALLPSHVSPAHKKEVSTHIYRTGLDAAPALSQSPHATKIMHLDQSKKYLGYHQLHQPMPQAVTSTPVTAGFQYEYVDGIHGCQIYSASALAALLPTEYQMMSSGGVVNPSMAVPQAADAKQSNAS